MSTFLKSLVYLIVFISIGLFYLFYTSLGNKHLYDLVSYTLSQKSDLRIEVKSIDLDQYPHVVVEMNIEKKAKLILNGLINVNSIDMDYILTSECIASDICEINDDIDIDGHINGPYSRMQVRGKGKALDGHVNYNALKFTDKVKDLNLTMNDINSTKLFTLMGYDALIKGKADVNVNFKLMEKDNIQGSFNYDVKDNDFSGLPLNLHAKVNLEGMKHTFLADITSPYLKLNITNGQYDQDTKLAKAFYILDIKDLSKLETLLGNKYSGPFYAMGEMTYDKYLSVSGLSKSYGGMLDYLFEKDGLHVKLEAVSFMDFMKIFPYPAMLDADVTGDIYYNFIQKTMVVNTALKNAKVVHADLVNIIQKKSGVDLLRETFNDSSLDATYHNSILLGDLKLANKDSHIFLTSTKIDMNDHTINAYFDFKMQNQEFSGKVYGSLGDPDVNLDLQKLIKYQMEKQLDSIMGKGTTKAMRSIPMEGTAENMATGAASTFMNMFF
ncbi:hypothetical protein ACFLRS_00835 [Campylobacterota bacterium]